MVGFVNPRGNTPRRDRIPAQPFGRCRALSKWGRVVTRIQFIARESLALTVMAFVGDIFPRGPESTAVCGFWACKRLAGVIGLPTSGRKCQNHTTDIVILGGHGSRSGGVPSASLNSPLVLPNYAGESPKHYKQNASPPRRQVRYDADNVSAPESSIGNSDEWRRGCR